MLQFRFHATHSRDARAVDAFAQIIHVFNIDGINFQNICVGINYVYPLYVLVYPLDTRQVS